MRLRSKSLPWLTELLALGLCYSSLQLFSASLLSEPWRPQFHFTPMTNWMNDPNGMVFYDGEYHLFYQLNPFGNKWGHMSWGHAVSRDLVHWQHLPVALYEENDVMIFSGSAVVDWKDTSGFGKDGKPPMVAIYTGHYAKKPLQNQHLAYSNDRGRTWTKYPENPVLDIGAKDFRDPKVFWNEQHQLWLMVVSWPVQRKVRFYSSPNLKAWTHLSDFGPAGSTNGIWECPDLFPVSFEKDRANVGAAPRQQWVLVVNVGSGAPAGGSGCQYFVGDFDGKQFVLDPSYPRSQPERVSEEKPLANSGSNPRQGPALWADWGRDFYAAVSWNDIPQHDGRRIWLGWMSNWEYANDVPTSPWRSAMSVPRELALRQTSEGPRLIQQPVRELEILRGKHHRFVQSTLEDANTWLARLNLTHELLEISVEFESVPSNGELGLRLMTGPSEETLIRFQSISGHLSLDRSRSGNVGFHPKFGGVYEAPARTVEGRLDLHIFVDTSSVEVFAAAGETVLTDLILPAEGGRRFEVYSKPDVGALRLRRLEVWELLSALNGK